MSAATFPAAENLSGPELEHALSDLLQARATLHAKRLSGSEAALLARVNAGLPTAEWAEYRRLQALRDAGTLSASEHADLLRLGDAVEAYQADRAAALADLAALRGQTLAQLADTLALCPVAE